MTSKQATLRQAAQHLRMSIFRSLPMRVRIAHVFSVLASTTARSLDEAVKAVLLKADNPDAARVRGVGDKVFKTLLKKYGVERSELIEDSMVETVVELMEGSERSGLDASRNIEQIKSFLISSVDSKVHTSLRRNRYQQMPSSLFDDDQEKEIDLEDPSSAAQIEDLFDASELQGLKRKLNQVLPWGGAYLDMLLDGYSDKEIIGDKDRGVPSMLAQKIHDQEYLLTPSGVPMSMASWSKVNGWKYKLRHIIDQHIQTVL